MKQTRQHVQLHIETPLRNQQKIISIYIYILEEFLAEKLGKVLVVMFIWTEFIQNEKELNPYLSSFSLLRRTKFEEFGKRYNITWLLKSR